MGEILLASACYLLCFKHKFVPRHRFIYYCGVREARSYLKKKKKVKEVKSALFNCCLTFSCYNIWAASFVYLLSSYDKVTTAYFDILGVKLHFC